MTARIEQVMYWANGAMTTPSNAATVPTVSKQPEG
jgi:hypothetical protein